jgi:hypothetical protein
MCFLTGYPASAVRPGSEQSGLLPIERAESLEAYIIVRYFPEERDRPVEPALTS